MEQEQINSSSNLSNTNIPSGFVPPTQTPTPPVSQPISVPPIVPNSPEHKSFKYIIYSLVVLILLIVAGFGYVYYEKNIGFSSEAYTQENFFSGISKKIVEIKTSTYTFSGSLNVVPREKDAEPFTLKVSNEAETKKQYFYDSQRANDAVSILGALRAVSMGSGYGSKTQTPKPYPQNIKNIFAGNNTYYGYSKSINDPETNKEYEYKVTENGNNFELTVNFGTGAAITAIKRYGYVATTTPISGKKVTFTKNSSTYIYLSSQPPKPFLVQFGEYMKSLPADINASVSFGASANLKDSGDADWKFNFDAKGDFGDLTYKVNAEALKSDGDYYFKINNIPSLLGDLSNIKGKWIKIPKEEAVSKPNDQYGYSMLSSLKTSISSAEKSYKENREKSFKFMKKAIEVADEVGLALYRSNPKNETVDGRELIRYEIAVNKNALVPYYKKLDEEINNDPDFSDYKGYVDQGLIDYLQSDEFNQVFDYVDKNNKLVIWTDKSGFPAIVQNTFRIVPPDTATQLKDKQVNITFKLTIDDINKKIDISSPKDFTLIDKFISDVEKNTDGARLKSKDAAMKAYLGSIMPTAEVFYDKSSSYGKTFALGPCKKTAGTLFAEKDVAKALDMATENNISSATCVVTSSSKGGAYAISVPLPSDNTYSWCIDSVNGYKQIIGAVKSNTCR
jgi:hypothetical protein